MPPPLFQHRRTQFIERKPLTRDLTVLEWRTPELQRTRERGRLARYLPHLNWQKPELQRSDSCLQLAKANSTIPPVS